MMPNMMPRVGAGSKPNVFYNTGHGHLGWTLSAMTADMVGAAVQSSIRHAFRYGVAGSKASVPA